MNTQLALVLPASAASTIRFINARCTLRKEEDQCVIVVAGLPVHHYRAEDAVAQAYAMVLLVESGFAQQTQVARAFDIAERTVRRYQERYAQDGMVGLEREVGWRRGRRRASGKRLRHVETLKAQGLSNRAIAQRLGVTEKAIRKLVGPSQAEQREQLALVTPASTPSSASPSMTRSAAAVIESPTDHPADATSNLAEVAAVVEGHAEDSEPVPMSLDREASDRTFDRQLAYLGLLDDAAPIFRDGLQVPGVGVLLALPCLIESGVLSIARKLYGGIGPASYGLRTTLLTLLLMALLRIQRPEHLKERDPAGFGRLLGLDRAPELKTLRRQLSRPAAHQQANELGAQLARLRVDQRGHLMSFLYVDGQVRAYHGERTVSRAFVARRHLAMPATTDYWINDRAGDPLLLITGDINGAVTTAFPNLLREVRVLLGERRATIVFDRGGRVYRWLVVSWRRDGMGGSVI